MTAEVYDPSIGSGTFAATGSLPGTTGTVENTATLRTDGTVLIAGGEYAGGSIFCPYRDSTLLSVAAAESFDP